jgi:hypothetical protein
VGAAGGPAGPDTAALARFHFDGTWTGTVEAGMMGPGSTHMEATGLAAFSWTDDGLWLAGEFTQDQTSHGRWVLTWHAHYLIGWDPLACNYVAFLADNCGHAGTMRGDITGDRMVLTTPDKGPARFRIAWDAADPHAVRWTDEVSIEHGPWQLIEQYVVVPLAANQPATQGGVSHG